MHTTEEPVPAILEVPADQFRQAMRELAGTVSVITVCNGEDKTGFLATSVSSYSAEPPRIIFCVNRNSSSGRALINCIRFGLNFMRETDNAIADRFAGFTGAKGAERYQGGDWLQLPSGTYILRNALASIDCTIEETFDRHDHTIVLGKVESIRVCDVGKPLLWFKSGYYYLGEALR